MSEEELLNLCQKGNEKAFYELVTQHQKMVYHICFNMLLHEQDAEDIAQEVFIELFRSIQNFQGHSKLSTYIYRIAVSKTLDELQRRKRKKRISSIGELLSLEKIAHWMSAKDKPDKILEEKEAYQSILIALESLPDNQRIALSLSKIEQYNTAEIAAIMNISTGAVESLIYRAKQKLKKMKAERQF